MFRRQLDFAFRQCFSTFTTPLNPAVNFLFFSNILGIGFQKPLKFGFFEIWRIFTSIRHNSEALSVLLCCFMIQMAFPSHLSFGILEQIHLLSLAFSIRNVMQCTLATHFHFILFEIMKNH